MEGLRGGHQRRAQHGVTGMDGQEFCQAVLAHIPRATAAEREAIQQELLEHLADHQEALEAGGMDAADAQARSVAAMGDAGEIGRQWNARLSPLWLWVGRVCKAVCILLMIVMFLPGANFLYRVAQNLDARWSDDPMENFSTGELSPLWSEAMDLRVSLGGQAARLCEVALVENAWSLEDGREGIYRLEVSYAAYAQNPLKPAFGVDLTCNGESPRGGGGSYNSGRFLYQSRYPIEAGCEEAVLTFMFGDESAAVSVDIPWEEVDGYGP